MKYRLILYTINVRLLLQSFLGSRTVLSLNLLFVCFSLCCNLVIIINKKKCLCDRGDSLTVMMWYERCTGIVEVKGFKTVQA